MGMMNAWFYVTRAGGLSRGLYDLDLSGLCFAVRGLALDDVSLFILFYVLMKGN